MIRFGFAVIAIGIVAMMASIAGVASAATPIGKGGRIYACYATTGQDKGATRLVGKKQRCHPGERKVYWSVAGPAGAAGARGPQGSTGQQGTPGSQGAPGAQGNQGAAGTTDSSLLSTVQAQAAQITALTGQISALQASVGSLCTQLTAVTGQANALRGAISGLALNGVLTALGGVLNVPALPSILPAYSCPV